MQAKRYELLLKVLGWGTAANIAYGGWFIPPSTTHQIFNLGKMVYEVDLITILWSPEDRDSDDTPRCSPYARDRGVSLLIASLLAIVVWASLAIFLNLSSSKYAERSLPRSLLTTYTIGVTLAFVALVLDIVDVFDK